MVPICLFIFVQLSEKATGPGGDWHKNCLTCKQCNKRLDSTTLAEHDGEAYCKACYGKNFGPKGFGFALGGAFMHTGYEPIWTTLDLALKHMVNNIDDIF
jgi:cysteine/glycine-rich protein